MIATTVRAETLLELYRGVRRIRRFEETVADLFKAGELPGFVHSYIGSEAVAAGVSAHLQRTDVVSSTHRGHGHCIAKGVDLSRMMAELYGKAAGSCKGKAGSMHIVDLERGILGCNGIVGGGIPMAVGAALAMRLEGRADVAVSFMGDGAANQGTFHESLNLASIWKLPVLFVIENNQYTEFFHYRTVTAIENLADRAASYSMPGLVVDGQNVVDVFEAAANAIQRCRSGEGPFLLEAKTYRFHGHYEGEDAILGTGAYRSTEELKFYVDERDPVRLARQRLLQEGTSENVIHKIDDAIEQEIADAVEFARSSPLPNANDILDDLFAPISDPTR